MITIRLSAADINRLLADVPDATIEYREGRFHLTRRVAGMRVTAEAALDLRDGHVRVALPFSRMRLAGSGLLGGVTRMIWPKWVEPWLERLLEDKLAEHGLPWEMVWVDTTDDPEQGRLGTINVSPRTLNEWLRQQPPLGTLVPRLVGLSVEPEALHVELALVDRNEPVPPWRRRAGRELSGG